MPIFTDYIDRLSYHASALRMRLNHATSRDIKLIMHDQAWNKVNDVIKDMISDYELLMDSGPHAKHRTPDNEFMSNTTETIIEIQEYDRLVALEDFIAKEHPGLYRDFTNEYFYGEGGK